MKTPTTMARALVALAAGALGLASAAHAAEDSRAEAQRLIWAKEQAVYAGRGSGDMGPYERALADGYVSWPPGIPAPIDAAKFKAGNKHFPKDSKEKLQMEFVDLALNGDTAEIYYRTHMTVSADGKPVDLYYQVTHTWVRRHGEWQVLGGMARPVPGPAKP